MKRSILTIILFIIPFLGYTQGIQTSGAATQLNEIKGGSKADSAQWLPKGYASFPWFDSAARIWYNPSDSSLYYHTGHRRVKVGSGGGGGSDTWGAIQGNLSDQTDLYDSLFARVLKSDSLTLYLTHYQWKADSALIMSNFALYMRYQDTANMLAPYLRKADAATLYYSISNPNNYITNAPLADTSDTLRNWANGKFYPASNPNNYINSESDPVANAKTVTINGNTQTLGSNPNFSIPATDTSSLSTRINLKLNIADSNILKGCLSYYKYKMDSAMFAGNIALAVKYTDTALMLQNYIRAAGWGLLKIGQALIADSSLLLPRGDSNINGGYLPFWTYTQAPAYAITNTDKLRWNNAYNNYPTAISWNTTNGILTVTLNSGATLTTSLDSRYLTIAAWATDSAFIANSYWSDSLNAFGGAGKIGTKDNNNFDIYTNAIQRVRITKSGAIFVGTTTDLGYVAEFNGTMGANKWQGILNTPLNIDMSNGNYIKIINGILCETGSGLNSLVVSPYKSTVTNTYADTVKATDNLNNLANNAVYSVAKHTYKSNSTNPTTHYGFADGIQFDTVTGANISIDTLVSFFKYVRYLESSSARQRANYLIYYNYDYGGLATHAFWVNGYGSMYANGTSTLKDTVFHHPKPGPNTTDSILVFNAACGCELLAPMPSGGGGGTTPGGSKQNLQFKSSTSTFGGTNQVNVDSTDNNLIFTYNNGTGIIAAPASGGKLYAENNIGFPFFHIVDTTAKADYPLQPSMGAAGNVTYATGYLDGTGLATGFGILSSNSHFSATAQQYPSYSATAALVSYNRIQISTGTTSGSSVAYYYSLPTAITTASRYVGGYVLYMRFGFSNYNSTERFFAGYEATWGGAWPNADPSSEVNIIGVGKDGTDATLQWMVNDGSGVATKTNTGITPNQNDDYELIVYVPASGGSISMQIVDYTPTSRTPTSVYTATTNIPASNTQISPKINLTNNATAANRVVDFIYCYQYTLN